MIFAFFYLYSRKMSCHQYIKETQFIKDRWLGEGSEKRKVSKKAAAIEQKTTQKWELIYLSWTVVSFIKSNKQK